MIKCYLGLLACQAIGEVIHRVSGFPLSGPIIGMALLLAILMSYCPPSAELQSSAGSLLGYLSLLFVPAGVGIMQHLRLLWAHWLPITLALLCSSLLAMASAALVTQSVKRLVRTHEPQSIHPRHAQGELE